MENIRQKLRPLSFIEKFRSRVRETGPDVGYYFVKAKSTVDVATSLEFYQRVGALIAKKNPLLRCKIVSDPNNLQEFRFEYVQDDECSKCFKFLFYESSTNDGDEGFKCFIEREINIPYEDEEQLLRFKILRTGFVNGVYTYYVLAGSHHGITDGLNFFNLILRFLKGAVEPKSESNDIILETTTNGVDESYSMDPDLLFPVKHMPFLAQLTTKRENSLRETKSDGVFYTVEEKKFVSLNEIANSKMHYKVKMKMFISGEDVYTSLSNESKMRNIKMTIILDLVAALALRQVVAKFSKDAEPIVSITPVNLRSRLNIGVKKMGLWMALYRKEYGEDVNRVLDFNFFNKTFWEIAKVKSDSLDEYTRTENANKQYEEQVKMCRHIFLNQDKLHTKNFKSTFVLTYINHEKLSSKAQTDLFDIVEIYGGTYYEKRNKKNMAAVFVSAIKRSLCWTITHKTEDLSVEAVDLWTENIQSITQKIMSNLKSNL